MKYHLPEGKGVIEGTREDIKYLIPYFPTGAELARRRESRLRPRLRVKPRSSRMPYSDEEALHIIDGISRLGCTKFAYKTIVKDLTQLGLGMNPAGTGRTPDAIKFYVETFVLHKLPSEGYHGLEKYRLAVDIRQKAVEYGITITPDFYQIVQKILIYQRQPKTQKRRRNGQRN